MDQPISIHKSGKWYFGESEMFRRSILKILARNIGREEDGSYYIAMGNDKNTITVEDVPFYATGISINDDGKLVLTFHDLQELVLNEKIELFLKEGIPYISFRWPADTRLSRGIYWKLSEYFEFFPNEDTPEQIFIVPPEKAAL